MASLEPLLRAPLADSVGPCYFRRLNGRVLITNDWGGFLWLSEDEFARHLRGEARSGALFERLRDEAFLRNWINFEVLSERYRYLHKYLSGGPSLHMVALTMRSGQDGVYAKALSGPDQREHDITLVKARRVARFIFDSPSPDLVVELRGGDPLLHWDGVEFLVRHLKDFAAQANRRLRLGLVSPLAALDAEKADFLKAEGVEVCAPLEGPADLHDALRPSQEGSSHAKLLEGLALLRERQVPTRVYATVTKLHLGRARDVVEETRRLGFDELQLMPLAPIGRVRLEWDRLGVSAQEHLGFYDEALRLVLEHQRAGRPMRERTASALLTKILKSEDSGLVELRTVFGGGVAELAYHRSGDVYLSEEGRLLDWLDGAPMFRLGSVDTDYRDVLLHPTVKASAVLSCLENQPWCSSCAYKPYCGVSTVYNYAVQNSLSGRNPTSERCALWMGIFDRLFVGLEDPAVKKVFQAWADTGGTAGSGAAAPFFAGGLP